MTLPLDVERLPGPEKVLCPCQCGVFGTPRRKAWADGLRHVRGCQCRRCVGSRQAGKARRRENQLARDIGGARQPMSGNLSGFDLGSGLWVVEETANKSLVRGLFAWWDSKQIAKKTARLLAKSGVKRAFVCHEDGRTLVVMLWEDFAPAVREDVASGGGL